MEDIASGINFAAEEALIAVSTLICCHAINTTFVFLFSFVLGRCMSPLCPNVKF